MMPQIVRQPAFAVLGWTTRTTNEREMSGKGRIGALWQTYLQGGQNAIPNVSDPALTFSIYTNYESDHTGAYDVILGTPVSVEEAASGDLRGIAIPSAQYAVFPAESATADGIRAAWMAVYQYFSGPTDLRRAFSIDFERYSAEGVQLYIAVRPAVN
jgi:predicted transcriptional regulator YdeE